MRCKVAAGFIQQTERHAVARKKVSILHFVCVCEFFFVFIFIKLLLCWKSLYSFATSTTSEQQSRVLRTCSFSSVHTFAHTGICFEQIKKNEPNKFTYKCCVCCVIFQYKTSLRVRWVFYFTMQQHSSYREYTTKSQRVKYLYALHTIT